MPLGYQFSVIHRHKRMMADVDALTRRVGPLIATHCCIAAILHCSDTTNCPLAYDSTTFATSSAAQLPSQVTDVPDQPIFSSSFISASSAPVNIDPVLQSAVAISTSPILFLTGVPQCNMSKPLPVSSVDPETKIVRVLKSVYSERWCIDNYFGSFFSWSTTAHPDSAPLGYKFFFTSALGVK